MSVSAGIARVGVLAVALACTAPRAAGESTASTATRFRLQQGEFAPAAASSRFALTARFERHVEPEAPGLRLHATLSTAGAGCSAGDVPVFRDGFEDPQP